MVKIRSVPPTDKLLFHEHFFLLIIKIISDYNFILYIIMNPGCFRKKIFDCNYISEYLN